MARFVVLANPDNRRCEYFLRAVEAESAGETWIISWRDYLDGRADLEAVLERADVLRIESPGEDFAVEKRILARGAEAALSEGDFEAAEASRCLNLPFDRGRIRLLRQWYLGWQNVLAQIRDSLLLARHCRVMNCPREIALMFDKIAAQQRLADSGVPVPGLLGTIAGFDDLASRCGSAARIFLKPCHASSASGVVALQMSRGRIQAVTSAEMVREGGELRLYNSLRMSRYTNPDDVRQLVDALCRQRVHAEHWFPKAGIGGRTFDLRILVVAGKAAHVVVRSSRSPITNLHLGNQRGPLTEVLERLGSDRWRRARAVCEQAAGCFPGSHYVAADLMVSPDFSRFAVAETNAFGDLLPRLEIRGRDTYRHELATFV